MYFKNQTKIGLSSKKVLNSFILLLKITNKILITPNYTSPITESRMRQGHTFFLEILLIKNILLPFN